MGSSQQHDASEWFTARTAAKLSGLSLHMINYLCREGLVEPSCRCLRGHGSIRHYSFGDVVSLRLIGRLTKAGISVLRLRRSLARLRSIHPEITAKSLPGKHIVTNGKDIFLRSTEGTIERALDGQFAFAFVIELKQLRDEVAERMKKLA